LDRRNGNFPRPTSPNPLLPENRQFIIDKVPGDRGGPRHPRGTATGAPLLLFIDDKGRFVRPLRLHDGDPRRAPAGQNKPGFADPLRRARVTARFAGRPSAEAGGRSEPNRVGHAFFKTAGLARPKGAISRRRGSSGHYYFPRLLQTPTAGGESPAAADPREAVDRGQADERAARALTTNKYFNLRARSTPRSPTREGKMREIEGALLPTGGSATSTACRSTTDAWHFKRAASSNTEPAASGCASSRSSSPEGHGGPGRDEVLGHHPVVIHLPCRSRRPFRRRARERLPRGRDDPLTPGGCPGRNSATLADDASRARRWPKHGRRGRGTSRRIVVTHPAHIDHIGPRCRILARPGSGAEGGGAWRALPAPWAGFAYSEGMEADDAFLRGRFMGAQRDSRRTSAYALRFGERAAFPRLGAPLPR